MLRRKGKKFSPRGAYALESKMPFMDSHGCSESLGDERNPWKESSFQVSAPGGRRSFSPAVPHGPARVSFAPAGAKKRMSETRFHGFRPDVRRDSTRGYRPPSLRDSNPRQSPPQSRPRPLTPPAAPMIMPLAIAPARALRSICFAAFARPSRQ